MTNQIDDKLCLIAEQVAKLEGGQGIARELFAISAEIDRILERHRISSVGRVQKAVIELMNYCNQINQDDWDGLAEKEKSSRKQIARLLAASDKWSGAYTEALELVAAEKEG